MLSISMTQHTYEDAELVIEAFKLKLDSKAAILEFGKFEELYQLQFKIVKHWLHKFMAMDPTKRGILTYQDFISMLDLPDCALLGPSPTSIVQTKVLSTSDRTVCCRGSICSKI
jgi:hypothetical protein